ncbi:AraC family transcriptional regulator [Streptomyces sp. HC44]|uniref:AraC family transcriptional regulator n=1 Tax=Streptomyces scabichelini TaxID=2711217 RepID=A0A6G4V1V3_9ACTN|nr:AraC family transcriptional regulator [Streptomyces scabichelini]NGO08032.1 AraC family transcriptional regulator [Streptomyces scabichelini]
MDVLSDVVAAMRTGSPFANREDREGVWRTHFEPFAGAGFHVVLHGACLLVPEDGPAVNLTTGDVVLTPHGTRHTLTDPGSAGAQGATALLCGGYQLDRSRPHPLLGTLPQIIHRPSQIGRHQDLSAAVSLLGAELQNPRPGTDAALPTLLDLLLLYALRAWIEDESARGTTGWPAALADPAIGSALHAIHDDPAKPWTVEALGKKANLSRATFSRRFAAVVGEPPLTYVTWWRLTVAARLLRNSDTPLAQIAQHVGYGSPFAFATAFKREHGVSPGRYRLRHRDQS